MGKRSVALLVTVVFAALTFGILIYLIDRQPGSVYFIPAWISLSGNDGAVFGHIGYSLPTFIHVYVFILLSFVFLLPSSKILFPVCILWFVVDSLLEFAQLPVIAKIIALNVPGWFDGIPFLENISAYFLAGTFDVLDLFSIALGSVAAYASIKYINSREGASYAQES